MVTGTASANESTPSDFTAADAVGWLTRLIDATEREHLRLGELDRLSGDGDFGANVAGALRRARTQLVQEIPETAEGVFRVVATAFAGAGGTSGPLLSAWFRAFGRELTDGDGTEVLHRAASAGSAAVQRLGHAEVGERTMVDAMAPAAEALGRAQLDGAPWPVALREAARAAAVGAASTADLLARKGRSSYIGEAARGVVDPGAAFVALIFETGVAEPETVRAP